MNFFQRFNARSKLKKEATAVFNRMQSDRYDTEKIQTLNGNLFMCKALGTDEYEGRPYDDILEERDKLLREWNTLKEQYDRLIERYRAI